MSDTPAHIPVLLDEVVGLLSPQPGQTCLDGTLGRGGHAEAIIPRLGPGGRYIGLDLDEANRAASLNRLRPVAEAAGVDLVTFHANFAQSAEVLASLGIDSVGLLLADLGFASTQVDDPSRGLSFIEDGPLDMRLDTAAPTTAADLIATLGRDELADVIYRFGEERMSRRIARKIVEHRSTQPIQTTRQLADLVRAAYGPAGRRSRIHPATRTFQALRIAVNGELDALARLLADLPRLIGAGGIAAIISFHSLEDRPVKQAFAGLAEHGSFEVLTRKPIRPGEAEARANPRSRSAKLRAARRLADSRPH